MKKIKKLARELDLPVESVIESARLALQKNIRTANYELNPSEERRLREALSGADALSENRPTSEKSPTLETAAPAMPENVSRRPRYEWRRRPQARRVFVHGEVYERMASFGEGSPIARRCAHALLQLQSWGETSRFKVVSGLNAGWRRTGLGGNHGSQFYLWWRRFGEPAGDGSSPPIFVRTIRHHDETDRPLSFEPSGPDWEELQPAELLEPVAGRPGALSEEQLNFAKAPRTARLLQGHPGTGKTTALLASLYFAGTGRLLYITKSENLAARALSFFEHVGDADATVAALSWRELLLRLFAADGQTALRPPFNERNVAFVRRLSAQQLGWWRDLSDEELGAEIRAFLVGRCWYPTVTNPSENDFPLDALRYKKARARVKVTPSYQPIIVDAARIFSLTHRDIVASTRQTGDFDLFMLGLRMAKVTKADEARAFLAGRLPFIPTAIVADEVQDLLPLEYGLIVELARLSYLANGEEGCELVMGGDEGQTVGQTMFDFGELADLVTQRFAKPMKETLSVNLRSPSAISEFVRATTQLYTFIEKEARPRGRAPDPSADPSRGEVIICAGWEDPEGLAALLKYCLTERSDCSPLIAPCSDEAPQLLMNFLKSFGGEVPDIEHNFADAGDVKGLEWPIALVVVPSTVVYSLWEYYDGNPLPQIKTRRNIDALRVAVSRATERLIIIEIEEDSFYEFINHLEEGVDSDLEEKEDDEREDNEDSNSTFLKYIQLSPREVIDHLSKDDSQSPEEYVRGLLAESERWLDRDLARADRLLRRAYHRLSLVNTPGGVIDPELRQRTAVLTAYAKLLAFRSKVEIGSYRDFDAELPDAADVLHEAGLHIESEACLALSDTMASEDYDHLTEGLKKLVPVFDSPITEIRQFMRETAATIIAGACAKVIIRSEDRLSPPPTADQVRVLSEIADLLKERGDASAAEAIRKAMRLWGNDNFFVGRYAEALSLYAQLPLEETWKHRANCFASLGDWRSAAEISEFGGAKKEALFAWRQAGNWARAKALAEEMGDESQKAYLDWVQQLSEIQMAKISEYCEAIRPTEKEAEIFRIVAKQLADWAAKAIDRMPGVNGES